MQTWRYLLVLLTACGFEVTTDPDTSSPPSVGFEFSMSGADEKSGTVMIPVILSHAADEPITVEYRLLTGNNGATPNTDFVINPGTLTFEIGEIRKEVPVMIVDDFDETEPAESFDIALSSPHNAKLDQERAIHSVRIADHVLPRITIGPTATTTMEGTQTSLLIKLDKPAEGPSTIVVGVAFNSPYATAADLAITDGTQVSINQGQMMVTVPIGEVDDALDEDDPEMFTFSIRGPSPNLVLGTSRMLSHAIMDNDATPTIGFQNPTSSINESTGTVNYTVRLSAASGRQVKVNFADDPNDTSGSNEAFVLNAPGTLTFNPNETQKNITVIYQGDSVDELDETEIIVLSSLVNAMPGNLTHTCTIVDNDTSSVSFSSSSATVGESNTNTVTLTVRLSTTNDRNVTIPFTVSGSATAGDDYDMLTASPITINAGNTQASIVIDIHDSSPGNESPETVVVQLGTPTNAPLGSTNKFTLTIIE